MFGHRAKGIRLSRRHKRTLRKTEIGYEQGPGTVLRDFGMFLSYISERRLRVTGTHQLPLKSLPEINARLTRPIEHGLQRPQQKSLPPIHGLYLLVRASGMTYIDEMGSTPYLCIDEEVREEWERLNATEQYGNLLECWLLRGKSEIVGERSTFSFSMSANFQKSLWFMGRIAPEGTQVAGDGEFDLGSLRYTPKWHNLGLLDLFGCIEIESGEPRPGEGWSIERISRTSFGDAVFALLLTEFFNDSDQINRLFELEELPYGIFQPIFKPYFPDWEDNLSFPEEAFRAGVHIFKVSWGRIWRRIAVPADTSFDILATTILNSVHFDQDHLYQFSYEDRIGSEKHINHPYLEEGPFTSQVSVGDLSLRVGQKVTFLFDFGDRWEFDLKLERVDDELELSEPTVLESHGESPEQYPTWDDEEGW